MVGVASENVIIMKLDCGRFGSKRTSLSGSLITEDTAVAIGLSGHIAPAFPCVKVLSDRYCVLFFFFSLSLFGAYFGWRIGILSEDMNVGIYLGKMGGCLTRSEHYCIVS